MARHGTFHAIMLALPDLDRRLSLHREVEKWSSTHADAILVVAAQGQIEKSVDTVDALHQMARAQFQRATSTASRDQGCDCSKT